MSKGTTLTFVELINQAKSIKIPILQRDYAQGRKEADEVRRHFLVSIEKALLPVDPAHPLDLDFVYGSFDKNGEYAFSVLDGQQRLTTLYLLHWYLAAKENRLDEFRECFLSSSGSRFTYKTRVSASEFFDALAGTKVIDLDFERPIISQQIVDKQWFFLSWKFDPTVKACLTMLDAMHKQFFQCETLLYDRIVDTQSPRIVFQYLDLESFGLSDELYIKMNARGKPLSDFENFKAWLCSQLEKTPDGKRLEYKLDQQWTDVFWNFSQKSDVSFDQLFLRFFNLLAFYRACECVDGSFERLDSSWRLWLRKLRESSDYISTDDLERFGSFDGENLDRIELVLDYFHSGLLNDEVLNVLEEAVTSSDYLTQAKFYAFVKFVESSGGQEAWTESTKNALSRWNRVTNNLVNNHRIDELSSFIPVVRNLSALSRYCSELYEYLAEFGMDAGFVKEQREEESLKARLILRDASWEDILVRYERHQYLQGKVGFLLDMAKNTEDGAISQSKFNNVAAKTAKLLSDDILRSGEFLLERALLAKGDYLILDRGSRYTFCVPSHNTYRDRSENWLRVVKEPVFENLVNAVGLDVSHDLKMIINSAKCGGWRQLIIENPEMISYCGSRLLHKENDLIYLLSKSTLRGYHRELRTYVLERRLREMQNQGNLPNEITSFQCVPVYGSDTPYTRISLSSGDSYQVFYGTSGFYTSNTLAVEDDKNTYKTPDVILKLVRQFFPGENIK